MKNDRNVIFKTVQPVGQSFLIHLLFIILNLLFMKMILIIKKQLVIDSIFAG